MIFQSNWLEGINIFKRFFEDKGHEIMDDQH